MLSKIRLAMRSRVKLTRCAVLLLSLILISGCINRSTAPEAINAYTKSLKPPEGLALIYVVRPWAFRAGAVSVPFEYSGRRVGNIGTDQYLAFYALPEELWFGSPGHEDSLVLDVEEQQTYFIKLEYEMRLNPVAQPTFTLMNESAGRLKIEEYTLSGSNPFSYTCGYDDLDITKRLYEYSLEHARESDHFVQGSACMVIAAAKGQMDVIRWGNEEKGLPVDNFVWGIPESPVPSTPLKAALDAGNLEIADYLLDNGASLYAVGGNFRFLAINHAVDSHNMELVKYLLDKGANPNQYLEGETALVRAIKSNQVDVAEYLLEQGAFVSYFDSTIADPLTVARQYNRYEIEQLLIDSGAIDRQAIARGEEAARKARRQESNQQIGEIALALLGVAVGVAAIYYTDKAVSAPAPSTRNPSLRNSRISTDSQTGVLDQGKLCSSDYACIAGQTCVKKPYSSTGVCMTAVNSYGLPTHKTPDSRSIGIKTEGDCHYSTDCPIGFDCHRTLKACVKN